MDEIDEILKEYVETANAPQYNSDWTLINSKFPELKDYDPEVLKEYVETANAPQYNSDWALINSKFPEFFESKKKVQPLFGEPALASGDTSLLPEDPQEVGDSDLLPENVYSKPEEVDPAVSPLDFHRGEEESFYSRTKQEEKDIEEAALEIENKYIQIAKRQGLDVEDLLASDGTYQHLLQQKNIKTDLVAKTTAAIDKVKEDTNASFGMKGFMKSTARLFGYSETPSEIIDLDKVVEDKIAIRFESDPKLETKALKGTLSLKEKEDIILEAKLDALNYEVSAISDAYKGVIADPSLDNNSRTKIVESLSNRRDVIIGAVGYNQATGLLDSAFKKTKEIRAFDETFSSDGFFYESTDALSTLASGTLSTVLKGTVGFVGEALTGFGDLFTDQEEYSVFDAFQDTLNQWTDFKYLPSSQEESYKLITEEGDLSLTYKTISRSLAETLPFTLALINDVRRGRGKNLEGAIGKLFNPTKSPQIKARMDMVYSGFRHTLNDNTQMGRDLGLDDNKARIYGGTLSLAEGVTQLIMPDMNFLTSQSGKIIVDSFKGNLKGAATKKAISGAAKEFSKDLLREVGEEEIMLATTDLVKYSMVVGHKNSEFLDIRNQKELAASVIILSTALGSTKVPSSLKSKRIDFYKGLSEKIENVTQALNAELSSGLYSPDQLTEIEEVLVFARSVDKAVKASPGDVTGKQVDLLMEKADLVEKMASIDQAYRPPIKIRIAEIEAEISKIEAEKGGTKVSTPSDLEALPDRGLALKNEAADILQKEFEDAGVKDYEITDVQITEKALELLNEKQIKEAPAAEGKNLSEFKEGTIVKDIYDDKSYEIVKLPNTGVAKIKEVGTDLITNMNKDNNARYISEEVIPGKLPTDFKVIDLTAEEPTAKTKTKPTTKFDRIEDFRSVDISKKVGVKKADDFLKSIEEDLDKFGQETLGSHIPVVVLKGAVQAMRLGVQAAGKGADLMSIGLNYIINSDWYKKLSEKEKAKVPGYFDEDLITISKESEVKRSRTEARDKRAKSIVSQVKTALSEGTNVESILVGYKSSADKEVAEEFLNSQAGVDARVEGLLNKGISESEVLESFDIGAQRAIAKDYLTRKIKLDPKEALAKVQSSYKASSKIWKDTSKFFKPKRVLKKLGLAIWDRQFEVKKSIKKLGMDLTRSYIIAAAGAGGYGKSIIKKANKEVYAWLSPTESKDLDIVIMLRRIIDIDRSRESAEQEGKGRVIHQDNLNRDSSEKALIELKRKLGKENFDKLNKRADAYFKYFKEQLQSMDKAGLLPKSVVEMLSDYVYQPREFIKFLEDYEDQFEFDPNTRTGNNSKILADPIKSLAGGSEAELVWDSKYLLAKSIGVNTKSVARNRANLALVRDLKTSQETFDKLVKKSKKTLTKKDKNFIEDFKRFSKLVQLNPVVGKSKTGKPIYKFKEIPSRMKETFYYKEGVKHSLLLEKDFYDQYYKVEEGSTSKNKPLSLMSTVLLNPVLKAFATGYNALFFISNYPIDFAGALLFSPVFSNNFVKSVPQVLFGSLKGAYQVSTEKDSFQKFKEFGGLQDFMSNQGRIKATLLSRTLSKLTDPRIGQVGRSIVDFVTARKIQMLSELAVRMAIFNQSVSNQFKDLGVKDEAGLKEKFPKSKQMLEDLYSVAASDARSVLDFNQGGNLTKELDKISPYLNASTQGARVATESFLERPFETTARVMQMMAMGTGGIVGASIFLLASNRADEPEEDKELSSVELYLKARAGTSKYVLSNYFIVYTGSRVKSGNNKGEFEYYRIRKNPQATPFLSFAENAMVDVMRDKVGDSTASKMGSEMLFSLGNSYSPFEVNPYKLFTSSALLKAGTAYYTGYDSYRDRPLSYMQGKVPIIEEGFESQRVEDFYKEFGRKYKISPARLKGALEGIVTSPSTNPMVGFLYQSADAMVSDQGTEDIFKDFKKGFIKKASSRYKGSTSDFNRRSVDQELLDDLAEASLEKTFTRNKFKGKVYDFIDGKITLKGLEESLLEIYKDSPYEGRRMLNKAKDIIKNQSVPSVIFDLKYEDARNRAIILVDMFGDGIEDMREGDKDFPLLQLLQKYKIFNRETRAEYFRLIKEVKKRD